MDHNYHESRIRWEDGPFSCRMLKAEGVLCPDGFRRTAFPLGDGIADTFFSIPAYVNAYGHKIRGYITVETVQGFSTPSEDDPPTVKFVPYVLPLPSKG